MNSFLKNLSWRSAIPIFDGTSVPEKDVKEILYAASMAPSSFNLQPWRFLVISNQEMKDKLSNAAFGQKQLSTASHVVVFCARNNINEVVDDLFPEKTEELSGYQKAVEDYKQILISENREEEFAREQVFISVGFALAAAAEKKVDTAPIGGFSKEEVKKLLSIPENESPLCILAIGNRDKEVKIYPKNRHDLEKITQYFL